MRLINPTFLFLFFVFIGFHDTIAQPVQQPISFNTGTNKIALIYKAASINNRLDTFYIDPGYSVKFLKDAIKKHYNLKIPPAYLKRVQNGGYTIKSTLLANHRVLFNEDLTISESKIDSLDIIEFDYRMTQSRAMACVVPDVIVSIKNLEVIEGAAASLILNMDTASNKTIIHNGSYQFYFNIITKCNIASWVAKLQIADKTYYLVNPTLHDFSTPINGKSAVKIVFTVDQ